MEYTHSTFSLTPPLIKLGQPNPSFIHCQCSGAQMTLDPAFPSFSKVFPHNISPDSTPCLFFADFHHLCFIFWETVGSILVMSGFPKFSSSPPFPCRPGCPPFARPRYALFSPTFMYIKCRGKSMSNFIHPASNSPNSMSLPRPNHPTESYNLRVTIFFRLPTGENLQTTSPLTLPPPKSQTESQNPCGIVRRGGSTPVDVLLF